MAHDHAHHGPPAGEPGDRRDEMRRLRWAIGINVGIVVAEVVGSALTGSLALLADAGHNLTDVASLALAYLASRFATLPPTREKTYGFYRLEILSALGSGVVLVLVAGGVLYEAAQHLLAPPPVQGPLMLVVGILAVGANLASMRVLEGSLGNLNVRGAWLHLLTDVVSAVGVVAASLLVLGFGLHVADPAVSVLIGAIILVSSWSILRESADVLLQATPEAVDVADLQVELETMSGVREVHDLHVWTLTSDRFVASLHVVLDPAEGPDRDELVRTIATCCRDHHGIQHTTVQVEGPGFTEASHVHR